MPHTYDVRLATTLKALSHPRRARLFRLLLTDPKLGHSFIDLQEASKINTGPLVHHLREMERCGLISRRRKGPYVQYILTPSRLLSACGDIENSCRFKAQIPSKAA